MRLLTYTYVALVAPLVAVTRRQPGARRALWIAALAIFAVSAMHLSQLHQRGTAWPEELVGHHASLPLAFAILYQDYPFALADLFLKRALSALAAVALAFGAIAALDVQSAQFAQVVQSPTPFSLLVGLWIATIVVFPAVRRRLVWFVDAVVLGRPDYADLRGAIARHAQTCEDTSRLLADVCTRLAPALSARSVTWRDWHPGTDADLFGDALAEKTPAAALATPAALSARQDAPTKGTWLVTVPASEAPQYLLAIGPLSGGRRFFSDDLAALEAIGVIVARRIDAIRLAAERYERALREREISQLATEAELRALRAQINPHFLFNALTTIGYLIQAAPPKALQTLLRLTALLRAGLRSEGTFTTLGRELEVIEAYLDIERARFEERLRVEIDVPADLRHLPLPPLVLQPLVENAVKHGIAPKHLGGEVVVRARLRRGQDDDEELSLLVRDTGTGSTPTAFAHNRTLGIGLRSVERRLACYYDGAASLSFHTVLDEGTTVEMRLPVHRPARVDVAAAEGAR